MKSKKRSLWFLMVVALAFLIGCDSPTNTDTSSGGGGSSGSDDSGVSESEAAEVAGGAMTAVNSAVTQALSDALSQTTSVSAATTGSRRGQIAIVDAPADSAVAATAAPLMPRLTSSAQQTVSYSADGVSVTGSITTSEDGSTFSYTLTTALSGYSASVGTVTGELTISGQFNGSDYEASYDGDFVVVSGGNTYQVSVDWQLSAGAFAGSYTVNGDSFSYGAGSGGGGTGGDDGGTTTSTGASFYTDGNGTNIDVWVNNTYRGQITQYFTSGTPSYGQNGTLTVSLSAGTHTLYAEDQEGWYWDGPFTLSEGQQKVLLLRR